MELRTRIFDAFAARPRPLAGQILREPAGHDSARLRQFLAATTPAHLSPYDLRTEVTGNLWMLAPDAFRYFLPGFLEAALESYPDVSVLVSELVGALTEPSRSDVVESLDRLEARPTGLTLPDDITGVLREQQLEWFDSGTPQAIFRERFADLSHAEGAAILAFLESLQASHGDDFPFGELQTAIDRHWSQYRIPQGLAR